MKRDFSCRIILLAILAASLLCGRPALAQTRLGLHVTQEELNIWRQRAQTGPYKSVGDVSANSPGDWDRISSKRSEFNNNPTADRWTGQTSGTCVNAWQTWSSPSPTANRDLAEPLMAAALYYLITGDTTSRTNVRNELLWYATTPGLNFEDTSRWCRDSHSHDANPFFEIATWTVRLMHAYDYVKDGLSSSDRATIENWIHGAGQYFEFIVTRQRNEVFVDPNNDNYSLTGFGDSLRTSNAKLTHFGGFPVYGLQKRHNNRAAEIVFGYTMAGLITNDARLKELGKRWVKEWIKYAIFPDGTPGEFERWEPFAPTQGWRYHGATLGIAVGIADALCRAGDCELYTYSTSDGIDLTAGGPKSLNSIVKHYYNYVDSTITRYGTDNPSDNANRAYRIDTEDDVDGQGSIRDVYAVQANVYFRDNYLKSVYMRTASGSPAYSARPEGGGYYPWGGGAGKFPGVLFMFGDMEGKVWPYPTGDAQPPSKSPTVDLSVNPASISDGQSSTLAWSSTNATSCSASGGWTGTKAGSGSEVVTPTRTTQYTLTCTGTGGTATKTVMVSLSSSVPSTNLANSTTLIAHSNNFSSTYSRGPQNLWDGDIISEDGSTGNFGIGSFWVEFDFGKVYNLTTARLFGDALGDWLCQTWTLEYKQKQTDPYTTAFTNSPCNDNQWFEQALNAIGAQYARITVFGNQTTLETQARELEIEGIPAQSTPSTNLANSSTLIAHSNNFSTTYPRGPQNLWDGDTISEEGSTGNSGIASFWVEFDFLKPYNLTTARLFGDAEGNWWCQSWTLEYKHNQTDAYTTAFTNSPCKGNQWFEQSLGGIQARYAKVTVFGNPIGPETQARELAIEGVAVSAPNAPTNLAITVKQQ